MASFSTGTTIASASTSSRSGICVQRSTRCPCVAETLTIPAHFNGPPESGNGGYTCGRVAQLVQSEGVEGSLRSPPPLDTPLVVARERGRVEVRNADTLIAEGRPAELLLDVPDPVPEEEVATAVEQGRGR